MSTHAASRVSLEPSSHFVYDFLAYPPSPRTRPLEPLPPTPTARATARPLSRRRSSTISISSWTTPGSHAFAPGNPPAVSRRPSVFRSPRSARRLSASFLSSLSTPTHTHTADIHAPDYVSTVVPLPITSCTAAPPLPPSYFPSNEDNDHHADMKFTLAAAPPQREGSLSVHASPFPPTPSKKKGLMRFLRPGPRPRSVTKTPNHRPVPRTVRAQSPPPSPTATAVFRIAHQKRAQYAREGALPLPLEAEVELMQFMDGGSRADATARLGAAAYTDEAGVVYSDETEAGECLPLLLTPDTALDIMDDNHSTMEDVFAFASSPPPSPLAPCTPPVPASAMPTSLQAMASSPRALLSAPARAGSPIKDVGASAYLHLAFDPSSVSPARGRPRRRRPATLTLTLPVPAGLLPAVIGFDDSFAPCCSAVSDASAVRHAELDFRGLRATRRE
ncbi:hypothetical protein EI94DRAFT_463640 [Lactarius quietus]|nr:hypothetical protein EI94DRAFT_463640 [Lactarius quietus]